MLKTTRVRYDYLSDFQKMSPELAYVLGFISGDGWISRPDANYYQIMVTNKISDRIYLEPTFMKVTNWQIKHKVEKTNFRQDQIRFTISNKVLINFLNEDLDLKNKSKYFSQKLIDFIPEHLHQYLLRGLFDADGGVYNASRNRFSCDIASNKDYDWTILKDFIGNKIDSNIHEVHYHIKHSNSNGSLIKANGFSAVKFLNYIYKDFPKDNIGFTRKFIRYVRFLEDRAIRIRNTTRIKNSELLGV